MNLEFSVINAFSDQFYGGNPAAVIVLSQEEAKSLGTERMQQIAAQFNLSETAFIIEGTQGLHIRWFTPTVEVELCGHASLAAAHAYRELHDGSWSEMPLHSASGVLTVRAEHDQLWLDFPRIESEPTQPPAGFRALHVRTSSDDFWLMLVLDSEEEVHNYKPDWSQMKALRHKAVVVTAKGTNVDFVSRCFAPVLGIDEDSVTGSAHCLLAPFWADQLGKQSMTAEQLSARRGRLYVQIVDQRVWFSGACRLTTKGTLMI